MKLNVYKVLISLLAFPLVFFTGCAGSDSQQTISESTEEKQSETNLITGSDEVSKPQENTVKVCVEDIYLQIPSDWTVEGTQLYTQENEPVLSIEINAYDEETLKEAFGYDSMEQCLRSYLPNGVLVQESQEIKYGDMHGFEYACTADVYSEQEESFVSSDDVVIIDFLTDKEQGKVYVFYFMDGMADSGKTQQFLQNIEYGEKDQTQFNRKYRWLLE